MPYEAPVNDPYNAASPDYDPETLPLDEVILEAMHAHSMGLRTAMPATVIAVNSGENQRVDVLPSLMSRSSDASAALPMPPIKNVPVLMTSGANYSIKVPTAIGDHGLLVFCDRSIDAWSASDGSAPVDPQDTRHHDLTDAVFVPGVVPFALQQTDATSDMVLTCGTSQLRLQQNGRVKIGGANFELFDLMDQFLGQALQLLNVLTTQTFVLTQLGPQPFMAVTQTALAQIQQTVQTLRTNLESVKGM